MLHRHPAPPTALPGPRGMPAVGSLVPFARDPLGFVTRMAETYGDMVTFRLVEHRLVQVNHPELVEQVLLGAWRSMHKDAIYDLLRPLLGNGLVTSEDETWKRNRKLAAPSFARKHVEIYADSMIACTEAFLARFTDGERDVHADMMEITQQIVLRTLFGEDLDVDPQGVAEHIETIMEEFVHEAHGVRRLLPRGIPTPGRRRADRAIAAVDREVLSIVKARRARGLGDDLLSRLLAARDEHGAGFDDRQLRDEAVTMFVAGHETTALALTYALVLLADHPAADDRLRDEVDEVLGDRPATVADLARLPWTTAVVKEAMRCLPPVWGVGRQAMEEVEIGGHRIAPGTQLLVCQWVLHHDRRWFDAPEQFRPERWLDGLESRLPRMAYLPFGGGPRICIGNHFALMEAVLVLATLSRALRFRLYGKLPPKLVPSITLRPAGPVRAHVARRG